jgi:broad specificity phosphatase PhoE
MRRRQDRKGEGGGFLLLVKHSLPEIEEQVPASQWHLSARGRRSCWPLAEELAPYAPDLLVCSLEPKAVETAQIVGDQLGIPVRPLPGLHEHERRTVTFLSRQEFEACAAKFFANPSELVFGEETAKQAGERFSRSIMAALAKHNGRNLAVISHGTVITLFVAQANQIEPFSFWKSLGLPSLVVLKLPGMELKTVVEEID